MEGIEQALRHCLERDLTFVSFHAQDQVHLWISLKPELRTLYINDLDARENIFIVEPFFNRIDRTYFLQPDLQFDLTKVRFDHTSIEDASGFKGARGTARSAKLDREEYLKIVVEARESILYDDLEKVVLSRTLSVPFDRKLLPRLFTRALKEQPDAFVCLLNTSEFGTWIGASPERLMQIDGDRLIVDSIAGTLPLNAAPDDPDHWGSKEREEQEYVTRNVIETLNASGLAGIHVSDRKVLRAAQVAHLHTRISAPADQIRAASIMKALHPTPAVCGTPRDRALHFIKSHEPHDRSLYTGFWGPWRWKGSTTLFVNLRCMQLLQAEAILYVGGGITGASDPGKEWAETGHKALTWLGPLEAIKAE